MDANRKVELRGWQRGMRAALVAVVFCGVWLVGMPAADAGNRVSNSDCRSFPGSNQFQSRCHDMDGGYRQRSVALCTDGKFYTSNWASNHVSTLAQCPRGTSLAIGYPQMKKFRV